MYGSKVPSVKHRIVDITSPWVFPIPRSRPGTPVESGPKFDISLDGDGYVRIERLFFEAY